jgi:hypothetical protein
MPHKVALGCRSLDPLGYGLGSMLHRTGFSNGRSPWIPSPGGMDHRQGGKEESEGFVYQIKHGRTAPNNKSQSK